MNINNIYNQSSLLDMLNNSTSKTDNIFESIIASNTARCQERISQVTGIKVNSTKDDDYKKVTSSSAALTETMDKLKSSSLWDESKEGYSKDNIISGIKDFVSSYNTLMTNIDNVGKIVENTYKTKFNQYVKEHEKELAEVGITIEKDGKMTIDKDKLNEADVSALKKVFGNDSEFMKKLDSVNSEMNEVVSKAMDIKNSMSGLYNANSSSVDYNSLLSGNSFNYLG